MRDELDLDSMDFLNFIAALHERTEDRHSRGGLSEAFHAGRRSRLSEPLNDGTERHGCRQSTRLRASESVRDQGRADQARAHIGTDRRAHVPERRSRQSRTGSRRGRARSSSCWASSRSAKSTRVMAHPAGPRRHAACGRHRGSAARLARRAGSGAATTAALRGGEVRISAGCVRPRADRCDHRRQLSGARPHAGPCRAGGARVPAAGDVRHAASAGAVRSVRGGGRHGGNLLHFSRR